MAKEKSGLSVQTLAISAAAAVAAAVVVPMIWERGTLIATAMTPVIVALVSEALQRPASVITAAAPRARRPRRAEPPDLGGEDPFGLRAAHRRPAGHRWRLAAATGGVAFAIAVVGLTMSELILGGAATRDSSRTTFFPGDARERDRDEETQPAPTPAPEEAEETPAPVPTETPAPVPTATPTPAPTETPVAPTPAPTP